MLPAPSGGRRLSKTDGLPVTITAEMREAGIAARQQRADARAADIAPTVKALQADGLTNLRAIAAKLNEAGIPTSRGGGRDQAS